MPFLQIECTPTLLSKLGLPERLDQKHSYHYFVFEHSDGKALLISQSYQHNSETFCTEVLVFRDRNYLIETQTSCKYYEDTWHYTLVAIRIYAERSDPEGDLSKYLPDLLSLYPGRAPYTRIPEQVSLDLVPPDTRSRAITERFPN